MKEILGNSLLSGRTLSCGCYNSENQSILKTTHAASKTRLYRIYHLIIERCYNKNTPAYLKYGARGVTVCDFWRESFDNFYSDMSEGYNNKLTIDRINPSGNYEHGNCRWIISAEQARNRTKRVDNTSGETGICLYKGSWYARWVDLEGKHGSKSFSALKYGDEAAKSLALDYRKDKLLELNTLGANYNIEFHGLDRNTEGCVVK